MPEIQTIGINYIGVNSIPLPNVNFSIPQTPPITLSIGSPIIDVPGCVKYNPANKSSIKLVDQDERGSRVMCDGSVPWFEPINYEPENLIYTQEQTVPVVAPPPETNTPEPNLDIPETPSKKDVPCPGPTDQRVGDMRNAQSNEIVVSHSLSEDGQICITNYETTTTIEKLLPTTAQLSTTAAIAVVATASAAATPLLLRLIKPLIKQLIKRIKGLLGKKQGEKFKGLKRKKKLISESNADD